MRINAIYLLLLIVLLFSCSKEDFDGNTIIEKQGQISFDFNIDPSTRLGYNEKMQTVFTPGDAIGVFGVKRPEEQEQTLKADENFMQNVEFVMQNDGSWKQKGTGVYYYPADVDSVIDFYAYYPYKAGLDPTEATLPFENVDIMIARTLNVKKNNGAVSLSFTHKMASLRVEFLQPGYDSFTQQTPRQVKLFFTEEVFYPSMQLDESSGSEIKESTKSCTSIVLNPASSTEIYDFFLPAYLNGKLKSVEILTKENETFSISLVNSNINIVPNRATPLYLMRSRDYSQLANSFVVKPGKTIHIPTYKLYRMWGYDKYLQDLNISLLQVLKVEVAWMDTEGLIVNSAELPVVGHQSEGVIKVKVAENKTGNAVITGRLGKTIRWSWHIWVTDTDNIKTQTYHNGDREFVFMDRNLGATSAESAHEGSKGLYYQWGRKDPFVGSRSWSDGSYTKLYDANNKVITASSVSGVNMYSGVFVRNISGSSHDNIINAITEPDVMYVGLDNPWGSETEDLWSATEHKSPYDPCPAGWRVPAVVNGVSPWNNMEQIPAGWICGSFFPEGQVFYPAAGSRYYLTGDLNGTMSSGYYWSAAPDNNANMSPYLYFAQKTPMDLLTGPRSSAFSVRCVKE